MTQEVAVFGGGCFWCTEAVFQRLKGVISVEPGYAGGTTKNPTNDAVCGGETGHAEVLQVTFDPTVISYELLLEVFFASHDPTTKNRQGNDVGTQYRSIILYTTNEQEKVAKEYIEKLEKGKFKGATVTTEVALLEAFYSAEKYHKDYYNKNQGQPYCQLIIAPKLEKLQPYFKKAI